MINNRKVAHPGVYIKDAIEALELNQSEFAIRTGMTIKNVSTLVNGESDITFEVATKLADFFGNSVEGWINLQIKYDMFCSEARREQEYNNDWEIVKYFSRDILENYLGIKLDKNNKKATIDALRKILNVNRLQNLKESDMYAFCKTSIVKDVDEKAIVLRNAWISIAERAARNIECAEFNKEIINANIRELRALTKLDPNEFRPKLQNILKSAGIKLVILPYFPGSNLSGVTKWISAQNCELVAINDCGKDAGKIWFTIFHEIGHAMKNHKRHLTISYEKSKIIDKEEEEANDFARNALINQSDYEKFVDSGNYKNYQGIKAFADMQNVADFIVIGRLQKDKYIGWEQFADRRPKYKVVF